MEFREGMLGVVVIALAFVGAFGVSYVAGIETSEQDVVKYNYLADVSGLFQYDKSPNYIEFDPSSNYVGYYSDTTGNYWPEEYLDYKTADRINNYKINQRPIVDITTENVDYSSLTQTNIPGTTGTIGYIQYWTQEYTPENAGKYTFVAKMTTLSQIIQEMGYGDYDVVKIASPNDANIDISGGTSANPINTGWIVFFPTSWVSDTGGYNYRYNLNITTPELFNSWQWPDVTNPNLRMGCMCISCVIDVKLNMVTLYSDNNFTQKIRTYEMDKVCVAFSSKADPFVTPSVILSDVANVTLQTFPPNEYLDPNYGVWMKDE